MIDHKELLKKFIAIAGEDSGQCQVLHVTEGHSSLVWTQEEMDELTKLNSEAWRDFEEGKWEEV